MRPAMLALVLVLVLAGCRKHHDEPARGSAGSGSARERKHLPAPLSLDDATAQCDHHIAAACGQLAFYYARGRHVPEDRKRAAELATPGCTSGDARSCFVLGGLLETEPEVGKRDDARAIALYKKACDAGDAAACAELGMAFFSGRTSAGADPNQAGAYLGKACDLGDDLACTQQGLVQRCLQDPKADPMCERMSKPRP
jgi:TPR repeat protein